MPAYRFPAEVDHSLANRVLAEAAADQTGSERTYDLSGCHRFDSALLAVLLELLRTARAAGATAGFVGANANLRRVAGLYGVDALLFGAGARAGAPT